MNRKKGGLIIFIMLLAIASLVVSADSGDGSAAPTINSVRVLSSGSEPQIEIRGLNFSRDPAAIQVMINDSGNFATIVKSRNKRIVVKIDGDKLCSGENSVRVFVKRITSNAATFQCQLGAPAIKSASRDHTNPGTTISITASNLSCTLSDNLVTFNNNAATVSGLNGDTLAVIVPDKLSAGPAKIRLRVGDQTSAPLDITIDHDGGSNPLHYINTGAAGTAGFSPMFANDEQIQTPGGAASLFDANFFGSHQAVINAPWQTIDGHQQVALLTINIGHSNSLIGNRSGQFEKFVYMRVNFPLYPEKPYDPVINPFWWGASAIATEHFPTGGLYFNSITQATGGVDSYSMSERVPGDTALGLSMHLVAPDILNYTEYGENYDKAGNGLVRLPKVATVSVSLDQITTMVPAAQFGKGTVTIVDESGQNGAFTTPAALFHSDVIRVSNQPQI